jgi:hypothetical protein
MDSIDNHAPSHKIAGQPSLALFLPSPEKQKGAKK